MYCPICGFSLEDNARFCRHCGAAQTSCKRGSHWVPLVLLAGLSAAGCLAFFLFQGI